VCFLLFSNKILSAVSRHFIDDLEDYDKQNLSKLLHALRIRQLDNITAMP
jgi:hypothetical protein